MDNLFDFIFDLPPKTLTLIAILLGFMMIDDLTFNEQNALGNFLMLIGQVLETSATQGQLLNSKQQRASVPNQDTERLKKEVAELKNQVDILNNK